MESNQEIRYRKNWLIKNSYSPKKKSECSWAVNIDPERILRCCGWPKVSLPYCCKTEREEKGASWNEPSFSKSIYFGGSKRRKPIQSRWKKTGETTLSQVDGFESFLRRDLIRQKGKVRQRCLLWNHRLMSLKQRQFEEKKREGRRRKEEKESAITKTKGKYWEEKKRKAGWREEKRREEKRREEKRREEKRREEKKKSMKLRRNRNPGFWNHTWIEEEGLDEDFPQQFV